MNVLRAKHGKTDSDLSLDNGIIRAIEARNEPIQQSRSKKGDAMDALRKLEEDADNLSADDLARLRKEARMARNRASAERTRLRRLEATRQLEIRVQIAKALRSKYMGMLEGDEDDVLKTEALLEEGIEPCVAREVAHHDALCKTGPAGFVLSILFSPNLLFLVTCRVALEGLVVAVQGGFRSLVSVRSSLVLSDSLLLSNGKCNSVQCHRHKHTSLNTLVYRIEYTISVSYDSIRTRPRINLVDKRFTSHQQGLQTQQSHVVTHNDVSSLSQCDLSWQTVAWRML
jgi:hypothetical protein